MYQPTHFQVTDLPTLHGLVEQHPLATWATLQDGVLTVDHVPFLLDRTRGRFGTLVGHVARANPVWRAPAPSVLVFHGPQAYITPNAYPSKALNGKAVPTWNYAVVHAHGTPRTITEPAALRAIVQRLTDHHEGAQPAPPAPWRVDDAPADYIDAMLKAIVGIELPIERLEGKWKVSQNQPEPNRQGVVQRLGVVPETAPMAALVNQPPLAGRPG